MKHLKNFKQFESVQYDSALISNLMESLSIWHDTLLSSIGAEQVDIREELRLGDMIKELDIDNLTENSEFINSLSSIGLKKGQVENTEDYETFINKPCKFMLIYRHDANELEEPEYILFQSWNEGLKEWSETKLYKLKEGIQPFYDRLSSKTIELIDGEDNYIYTTSNGNEWELQNSDKETDKYKKVFRKEEFQDMLNNDNIKLNII